MKVWGVFCCEMLLPYWTENLMRLYQSKEAAEAECASLNVKNADPLESDSYGPYAGSEYQVRELDVL